MSFSVHEDSRQPEVHASTLLQQGDWLLSAWFGGTKEGYPDTKIWIARRQLGGSSSKWLPPAIVAEEDGLPHWNPVLFQKPNSKSIYLFYKTGSLISSWKTKVKTSEDGGHSWSQWSELVEGDETGGRGPVKNKPVLLSNGTILAAASKETPDGRWDCFSDWSTDGGLSWTRSDFAPLDRVKHGGEGAIQPTLAEFGGGRVSMIARSSCGFVMRADSADYGRTWGDMYPTSLWNNNSGLDSVKLDSGLWLVAHNPVKQRWGPRTPLVISGSIDEGKTWEQLIVLEDKAPPKGFTGIVAKDTGIVSDGTSEFSYPAIISDSNGGVFVSYTYERRGIKHVHIDASELLEHLGARQ